MFSRQAALTFVILSIASISASGADARHRRYHRDYLRHTPSASQCDRGWNWNAAAHMCMREGRPSLAQRATSFEAANCNPGETRRIVRKFAENGHQITRTVTQTCGTRER